MYEKSRQNTLLYSTNSILFYSSNATSSCLQDIDEKVEHGLNQWFE